MIWYVLRLWSCQSYHQNQSSHFLVQTQHHWNRNHCQNSLQTLSPGRQKLPSWQDWLSYEKTSTLYKQRGGGVKQWYQGMTHQSSSRFSMSNRFFSYRLTCWKRDTQLLPLLQIIARPSNSALAVFLFTSRRVHVVNSNDVVDCFFCWRCIFNTREISRPRSRKCYVV